MNNKNRSARWWIISDISFKPILRLITRIEERRNKNSGQDMLFSDEEFPKKEKEELIKFIKYSMFIYRLRKEDLK